MLVMASSSANVNEMGEGVEFLEGVQCIVEGIMSASGGGGVIANMDEEVEERKAEDDDDDNGRGEVLG